MSTSTPTDLVSIRVVADRLRVNPKTVRRRISEGALPAYRLGPRTIRVSLADADRLLKPMAATDQQVKP